MILSATDSDAGVRIISAIIAAALRKFCALTAIFLTARIAAFVIFELKFMHIFLVRFSHGKHFSSTATTKEFVWIAWDLLACGREEGGQNEDNFGEHHDEK